MRTVVFGAPLVAGVVAIQGVLGAGAAAALGCGAPPGGKGYGVAPVVDPAAAFVASPYLGEAPLAVRFVAQEVSHAPVGRRGWMEPGAGGGRPAPGGPIWGGPPIVYLWDFGDGAIDFGRDVTHVYTQAGEYHAELHVLEDGFFSKSEPMVITVADGSYDVNGAVTANEARRFLWQAAFGPRPADVNFIVANGYEAWIDAQLALAPTLMRVEDLQESINRQYGWGADTLWDDVCVEAPDQLRQRMAWALLQVLVMNDPQDDSSADMLYYSSYIQHALGNYRDLLGYVTFSHQMGVFLTYIGNMPANPETGSVPDENYAREVMQLFSIGLWALNPDGTRAADELGNPIPTYDNETVKQFARVFTGLRWTTPYSGPMLMVPTSHEFGAKQLLNYPGAVPPGGFIPAIAAPGGQTAAAAIADINAAIDNVFHHPNCGPFVADLLIKRMVTSNPTPAYVRRVAEAFEGQGEFGSGVRGDLAATVKAILLDPEARNPKYRSNPLYGRVKEPMVVRWGLYRVLERVDRPAEVFPFRINADPYQTLQHYGQAFMGSPSVFNFYLPQYVPPRTPLATFHFYAPELQIYNDYTAMATQGRVHDELVTRGGSTESGRYNAWRALSSNPAALVDALDHELLNGSMRPEARAIIVNAVGAVTGSTDRVRTAVWLVVNSPDFRVLK